MQLQNFLAATWAEQVSAAIVAADAAAKAGRGQVPAYDAGICGGWQAVGPCHKQRYLRYAPAAANGGDAEGAAAASAVGGLLAQIRDELFSTAAFARLLTKVGGGRAGGDDGMTVRCACKPGPWPHLSKVGGLQQQPRFAFNPPTAPTPLPHSSRPLVWRGSRARCAASGPPSTTQWRTMEC